MMFPPVPDGPSQAGGQAIMSNPSSQASKLIPIRYQGQSGIAPTNMQRAVVGMQGPSNYSAGDTRQMPATSLSGATRQMPATSLPGANIRVSSTGPATTGPPQAVSRVVSVGSSGSKNAPVTSTTNPDGMSASGTTGTRPPRGLVGSGMGGVMMSRPPIPTRGHTTRPPVPGNVMNSTTTNLQNSTQIVNLQTPCNLQIYGTCRPPGTTSGVRASSTGAVLVGNGNNPNTNGTGAAGGHGASTNPNSVNNSIKNSVSDSPGVVSRNLLKQAPRLSGVGLQRSKIGIRQPTNLSSQQFPAQSRMTYSPFGIQVRPLRSASEGRQVALIRTPDGKDNSVSFVSGQGGSSTYHTPQAVQRLTPNSTQRVVQGSTQQGEIQGVQGTRNGTVSMVTDALSRGNNVIAASLERALQKTQKEKEQSVQNHAQNHASPHSGHKPSPNSAASTSGPNNAINLAPNGINLPPHLLRNPSLQRTFSTSSLGSFAAMQMQATPPQGSVDYYSTPQSQAGKDSTAGTTIDNRLENSVRTGSNVPGVVSNYAEVKKQILSERSKNVDSSGSAMNNSAMNNSSLIDPNLDSNLDPNWNVTIGSVERSINDRSMNMPDSTDRSVNAIGSVEQPTNLGSGIKKMGSLDAGTPTRLNQSTIESTMTNSVEKDSDRERTPPLPSSSTPDGFSKKYSLKGAGGHVKNGTRQDYFEKLMRGVALQEDGGRVGSPPRLSRNNSTNMMKLEDFIKGGYANSVLSKDSGAQKSDPTKSNPDLARSEPSPSVKSIENILSKNVLDRNTPIDAGNSYEEKVAQTATDVFSEIPEEGTVPNSKNVSKDCVDSKDSKDRPESEQGFPSKESFVISASKVASSQSADTTHSHHHRQPSSTSRPVVMPIQKLPGASATTTLQAIVLANSPKLQQGGSEAGGVGPHLSDSYTNSKSSYVQGQTSDSSKQPQTDSKQTTDSPNHLGRQRIPSEPVIRPAEGVTHPPSSEPPNLHSIMQSAYLSLQQPHQGQASLVKVVESPTNRGVSPKERIIISPSGIQRILSSPQRGASPTHYRVASPTNRAASPPPVFGPFKVSSPRIDFSPKSRRLLSPGGSTVITTEGNLLQKPDHNQVTTSSGGQKEASPARIASTSSVNSGKPNVPGMGNTIRVVSGPRSGHSPRKIANYSLIPGQSAVVPPPVSGVSLGAVPLGSMPGTAHPGFNGNNSVTAMAPVGLGSTTSIESRTEASKAAIEKVKKELLSRSEQSPSKQQVERNLSGAAGQNVPWSSGNQQDSQTSSDPNALVSSLSDTVRKSEVRKSEAESDIQRGDVDDRMLENSNIKEHSMLNQTPNSQPSGVSPHKVETFRSTRDREVKRYEIGQARNRSPAAQQGGAGRGVPGRNRSPRVRGGRTESETSTAIQSGTASQRGDQPGQQGRPNSKSRRKRRVNLSGRRQKDEVGEYMKRTFSPSQRNAPRPEDTTWLLEKKKEYQHGSSTASGNTQSGSVSSHSGPKDKARMDLKSRKREFTEAQKAAFYTAQQFGLVPMDSRIEDVDLNSLYAQMVPSTTTSKETKESSQSTSSNNRQDSGRYDRPDSTRHAGSPFTNEGGNQNSSLNQADESRHQSVHNSGVNQNGGQRRTSPTTQARRQQQYKIPVSEKPVIANGPGVNSGLDPARRRARSPPLKGETYKPKNKRQALPDNVQPGETVRLRIAGSSAKGDRPGQESGDSHARKPISPYDNNSITLNAIVNAITREVNNGQTPSPREVNNGNTPSEARNHPNPTQYQVKHPINATKQSSGQTSNQTSNLSRTESHVKIPVVNKLTPNDSLNVTDDSNMNDSANAVDSLNAMDSLNAIGSVAIDTVVETVRKAYPSPSEAPVDIRTVRLPVHPTVKQDFTPVQNPTVTLNTLQQTVGAGVATSNSNGPSLKNTGNVGNDCRGMNEISAKSLNGGVINNGVISNNPANVGYTFISNSNLGYNVDANTPTDQINNRNISPTEGFQEALFPSSHGKFPQCSPIPEGEEESTKSFFPGSCTMTKSKNIITLPSHVAGDKNPGDRNLGMSSGGSTSHLESPSKIPIDVNSNKNSKQNPNKQQLQPIQMDELPIEPIAEQTNGVNHPPASGVLNSAPASGSETENMMEQQQNVEQVPDVMDANGIGIVPSELLDAVETPCISPVKFSDNEEREIDNHIMQEYMKVKYGMNFESYEKMQINEAKDTLRHFLNTLKTKDSREEIRAEVLRTEEKDKVVRIVVESLCSLLGFTDLRWANIQALFQRGSIELAIRKFKIENVTKETWLKVREYLLLAEYDEEEIYQYGMAFTPLAKFVRVCGFYLQLTKYKDIEFPDGLEIGNLKANSAVPQFNLSQYGNYYRLVREQIEKHREGEKKKFAKEQLVEMMQRQGIPPHKMQSPQGAQQRPPQTQVEPVNGTNGDVARMGQPGGTNAASTNGGSNGSTHAYQQRIPPYSPDTIPHPAVIPCTEHQICPDIAKIPAGEIDCGIQDLQVVNLEFGEILFPGLLDVRGIDFNSSIVFTQGCVQVYPDKDEDEKPARGVALNRPAAVCMYNCKANLDRDLSEMSPQEKHQLQITYSARVKDMTERNNAEFVSYDIETGNWRFNVEYFS